MAAVLGSGRQAGIGKEVTPGTSVAPTIWIPHRDNTFEDGNSRIFDTAGMGTRYGAFQGDTNQESSSGNLNASVYPTSFGHIALAAMGSVATVSHATATGAKVHTFTVSNSLPSWTVGVKDDNESKRMAGSMLNSLEMSFELEDYVTFTSSWLGQKGTDVANTVTYVTEKPFRPQDVVVKIADTVAGLSAGTALEIEGGTFSINNNLITRGRMSTVAPRYFPGRVESGLSFSRLYLDTTAKDLVFGSTAKAMSIKMTRSDVSIGTGAPTNPSVEIITQPGVFSDWTREGGLDDLKDESFSLQPLFSTATGKQFEIIVTNMQASY